MPCNHLEGLDRVGGKEVPEGGDICTLPTGSGLRKEYNRLFTVTLLFTLYAEDIIRNATRLDELQAGVKIPGRNINNLRYADTTLMAETEEELKSLLMRVKEESETAGSKLSIQKTLRSWHLFPSLHGKQKGEKWKQ